MRRYRSILLSTVFIFDIVFSSAYAQLNNDYEKNVKEISQENVQIQNILLNGTVFDIEKLIKENKDVNSDYGCTSMLNKSIQGFVFSENPDLQPEDIVKKVKFLLEAGADVNLEICRMTPLAMAVSLPELGRQLEMKFMATLNDNINSSDGVCSVQGIEKPCIITTEKERLLMRKELHEVFVEEQKKIEPYIIEIISLLLKYGADINKPSHGVSPIFFATNTPKGSSLEILKFLLANGANPNVKDFQGNTPIFVAQFANNPTALKLLLEAKADTSVRNNEGLLYTEFK